MTAEAPAGTGLLSVIVPLFDEADVVERFAERLLDVLEGIGVPFEVWLVDDGSLDTTAERLDALRQRDERIGVLVLSRNFGHQAALTAALDHARGDWIVSLDGDGQHPPEVIPRLLEHGQAGIDVVIARRRSTDAGLLKRWTSSAFYRLLNLLSSTPVVPDAADFRLLSRRAALALRGMRERHRFLRGMVHWIGFSSATVPFDAAPRWAGRAKYGVRRMLRLAGDALFSFSLAPLRIAIVLGMVLVVLASLELSHTLWMILSGRRDELVPGWASLIFAVLGIGGVQLITLGIIGQYVGMIFEQVKDRPLYVLRQPPAWPRRDTTGAPAEVDEP